MVQRVKSGEDPTPRTTRSTHARVMKANLSFSFLSRIWQRSRNLTSQLYESRRVLRRLDWGPAATLIGGLSVALGGRLGEMETVGPAPLSFASLMLLGIVCTRSTMVNGCLAHIKGDHGQDSVICRSFEMADGAFYGWSRSCRPCGKGVFDDASMHPAGQRPPSRAASPLAQYPRTASQRGYGAR